MTLKRMIAQDVTQPYDYAPMTVPLVLNTEHVVSAMACDARGFGPWMRVRLVDGSSFVIQGRPEDLVE